MIGDSENNTLDNIKNKIQEILNKKFANDSYIKRKIDVYHDRLNFSCVYCGDSRSDVRKKRGNLYLDSLRFHCFNCGHSAGINRFLSDFNEELSNELYSNQKKAEEIQEKVIELEKNLKSIKDKEDKMMSELHSKYGQFGLQDIYDTIMQ